MYCGEYAYADGAGLPTYFAPVSSYQMSTHVRLQGKLSFSAAARTRQLWANCFEQIERQRMQVGAELMRLVLSCVFGFAAV